MNCSFLLFPFTNASLVCIVNGNRFSHYDKTRCHKILLATVNSFQLQLLLKVYREFGSPTNTTLPPTGQFNKVQSPYHYRCEFGS